MLDLVVGVKLGLINEKIEFFFRSYKLKVYISLLFLVVGRIFLKRKYWDNVLVYLSEKNRIKFVYIRYFLVLFEKVVVCIRNNEFVLFVGEIGIGKISIV